MNDVGTFLKTLPPSAGAYKRGLQDSFRIVKINDLSNSVILGTGELGKKIAVLLNERKINYLGFADNNRSLRHTTFLGHQVFLPTDLKNLPGTKVIIASKSVREINHQLKQLEVKRVIPHYVLSVLFPQILPNPLYRNGYQSIIRNQGKIESAYKLLTDDLSRKTFLRLLAFRISLAPSDLPPTSTDEEYFPKYFWPKVNNEVFVDVGAFDGDTLKNFLRHNSDFEFYYAIEPDPKNYQRLRNSIHHLGREKIKLIRAGAGAKEMSVSFSGFGRDDSRVEVGGGNNIKILPLDKICFGKEVTTIKIDVEGYEPEVLRGAVNLMRQHHPRIAICVYHRPSHLWEMLLLLREHGYRRFWLRHHGDEIYGTVLYALS